jgi:hypothetical protein
LVLLIATSGIVLFGAFAIFFGSQADSNQKLSITLLRSLNHQTLNQTDIDSSITKHPIAGKGAMLVLLIIISLMLSMITAFQGYLLSVVVRSYRFLMRMRENDRDSTASQLELSEQKY